MNSFSLGISTCPNDTFSFYALLHQKLNHSYQFKTTLTDIENLNTAVFKGRFDISKLSLYAFFHCIDRFNFLTSGAALGSSCGPLLVSKKKRLPKYGKIAIPGEHTTAAMLFRIFYGLDFKFCYMPFHQIMKAVQTGEVDAGVIIHESRFTYPEFGLTCLADLGEKWFLETGELIPLGGIAISKDIKLSAQADINQLLKCSIQYAMQHTEEPKKYIQKHSIEKSQDVIQKHIDLYVNNYSVDLGQKGKSAISTLFEYAVGRGVIKNGNKIDINTCFIA